MSKKILIIGLGESGLSAGVLALNRNYDVDLFDVNQKLKKDQDVINLLENGACWLSQGDVNPELYDDIIVSPGIDTRIQPYSKWIEKKIFISEVQFALKGTKYSKIAVTGTNGKSSLTKLITHALIKKGVNTVCCGNYGPSVSRVISDLKPDQDIVLVIELSSFQIERLEKVEFSVGVCLPLTPDHLNRYHNFNEYQQVKQSLFVKNIFDKGIILHKDNYDDCIKNTNTLVYDSCLMSFSQGLNEQSFPISQSRISLVDWSSFPHNVLNLNLAWAVLHLFDPNIHINREIFIDFEPLPYRLNVTKYHELTLVNDSKSSTPDSVLKALDIVPNKTALILGGRNKKSNFSDVVKVIQKRNIDVFIYGEFISEASHLFSGYEVSCGKDFESILELVYRERDKYEVVLLSPGCESFDQFKNYKERGQKFDLFWKKKLQKEKEKEISMIPVTSSF